MRRPEWVVNPIDTFVLARLEAEGLSPSVQADRVTILRRLSLDLIGLPPTIEEVDVFLAEDIFWRKKIWLGDLFSWPKKSLWPTNFWPTRFFLAEKSFCRAEKNLAHTIFFWSKIVSKKVN